MMQKCKEEGKKLCDSKLPKIQKPHFIMGEMMDEANFVFKEEIINQTPHW
ncbi:hypothetical protein QUF74_01315 [Candidatus Halobeggiatoa sp. HSG11]|nr:hypothetical protein [Candidatus Halobeggiatoa sp. HSG11]